MSLPKSGLLYTEAEYLALERESEERHEYLDGLIYAMAGESPEHGAICTNLVGQLYNQLRGKPCQAFSKDTKVRSGPAPQSRYATKGLYSCPDIMVVCGEPRFHDKYRDVLINPTVIIEVLSPTTEGFDRGLKFVRYRTHLESLTDYVVVSQSRPLVEHFTRQPDSRWLIATTAVELAESVALTSIDCELVLNEVYDRVVFPTLIEEEEELDRPND
ncbi:MAG: Uma2 family endonuclease [Acidobacteriota bacterium]|nr:Uma2 family endonuclease [Acidobacteriota bacterium]